MQTPTDKQLNAFKDQLYRVLGNNLTALILHGSLTHTAAKQDDRRDADLLIVVTDLVLEQARPLVDRLRWSTTFGHLNLAHNLIGYQQLCTYLAEGHPFFVSAIQGGRYLSYRKGVMEALEAQLVMVPSDELCHRLQEYSRMEQQRVEHALREVFRGLVNLGYGHLQTSWLKQNAHDRKLSPKEQQKLANWPALLESLEGDDELKSLLQALFEGKTQLSRGEVPKLCQEGFTLLHRLSETLPRSPGDSGPA